MRSEFRERTTTNLLWPSEALALLNFAALFHEVIYLTDTALGDHRLIIESFQRDPHSGLFSHIRRFIEEGILRVLIRSKVVVRDKVLVERYPTLREIYEGWKQRDKEEWAGETGFTTVVADDMRYAYYRAMDKVVEEHGAAHRYDPDVPKRAFREMVREQLERPGSTLTESLSAVPDELRQQYRAAVDDEWFTNADLWRVLKRTPASQESIILHAHINQRCFADLTSAGLSGHDRTSKSLASFNMELQRRTPMALELDATIHPPRNLDELLERAAVRLNSPGVEMFEHLSVETVIALRRRAQPVFDLARKPIPADRAENLRTKYLKALEEYWSQIYDTFKASYPEKLVRPNRGGLFFEEQLPSFTKLYSVFGRSIFATLLRLGLVGASPALAASSILGPDALHRVGVVLLQERTVEGDHMVHLVPPAPWYPRAMLGLDRTGRGPGT